MAPEGLSPNERSSTLTPAPKLAVVDTAPKAAKNSRFSRIIIYPKDVQCITGKSERYGRTMLRKVKDHFQKESHQFVTIDEFCEYTGIGIDVISVYLS